MIANLVQEEVDDVGLVGRFSGEEWIDFIHHSRLKPEVDAKCIRKWVGVDEAMYHSKQ
ncbi:hypothetical protein [Paenibacillus marinisediminis]